MRKSAEAPKKPEYPTFQRRCKYCNVMFQTKPTYQQTKMKFCCAGHRKAFQREGKTPMGKILSRQEKRMREIVREELNGVDWFQFVQALTKEEHPLLNFILDSRKVLPRVARP